MNCFEMYAEQVASTTALSCTTDLDGSLVAHDDTVVSVCRQLVESHDCAAANRLVSGPEVAHEVGHGPGSTKGGPVAGVRAAVFNGLSQTVTEPVVRLWTETVLTMRPLISSHGFLGFVFFFFLLKFSIVREI